ncbi:MAG: hypothetical protein AAF702_40410 [Chloroflexota bacterium]
MTLHILYGWLHFFPNLDLWVKLSHLGREALAVPTSPSLWDTAG